MPEEISMNENTIEEINLQKPEFEDGGYGWVVVAASFFIHICSIAVTTSFGVFQEHYKNEVVFSGARSTLAIAFIGSFGNAAIGFFAVPSGRLTDLFGHKSMCILGGFIQFVALLLASFSDQYWQFLLTQGCLFGIGCAIAYFPALTLISHWFQKKKGLATGIAVSGSGMGGLVVAPVVRSLISTIGVAGTLRSLAGFCGIVTIISGLLLKTNRTLSTTVRMDYMKIATDIRFIKLFSMAIVASLGYFIPFFFIPTFAVQYGMTKSEGALILGLVNGASAAGRILLGLNADFAGHLNTLFVCIFVASCSVLFIWPFATSFGILVFFGVMYGFFIGGFISLLPTAIFQLFGLENIATITGMVYSGLAFGNLMGAPGAGALLDALSTIQNGLLKINFLPTMLLCGISLLVASIIIFSIKWSASNRKLFCRV
jgi:MFS family permease